MRSLLVLPLLLLCHCDTAHFYSQALTGHLEIQHAARPINAVLADPATSNLLRQKLSLIQELRHYAASRLQLPAQNQYHRYADLHRDHLVWVVFAAPEFSLEPHTWHYPLLGDLSYRGYFKQAGADTLAHQLRQHGHDVFIAEVDAYSTLGWFSDPVLNTFIKRPDHDLAELVFHELTHHRLYLPGDTDFNEALATAVGRHATRRWLIDTQRTRHLAAYDREHRILTDFLREIELTRATLAAIYARTDLSPEARRQAKSAAFQDLRQRANRLNPRHDGTLKLAEWFAKPLNNARLNAIATYHHLVPAFESHLRDHCQNNLETFFDSLQKTRRLSPQQRLAWLHDASPTADN